MTEQYLVIMQEIIRFKSKAELAQELGISRETLRKKLKEIEGLNTGRRELRLIYRCFNEL